MVTARIFGQRGAGGLQDPSEFGAGERFSLSGLFGLSGLFLFNSKSVVPL